MIHFYIYLHASIYVTGTPLGDVNIVEYISINYFDLHKSCVYIDRFIQFITLIHKKSDASTARLFCENRDILT